MSAELTLVDASTGEILLSPPELAAIANEAHTKFRRAGEAMVGYAIEAGQALIAAKAQVGHGNWLPWLEANFDDSERTAQRYMMVASNPPRVADLTEPSLRALEAVTIESRKAEARLRDPEPVPQPIPPPPGKYRCLVIDPPWPMQKIERDERPDQGVALDYPVMSLEQIADDTHVPVHTLADEHCHIYLWVTHKFLPAGMDLLKTWDFRYQCVMTWRKNVGITPYSWMYDTEHVLFGRRGDLPLSRLGLRLSFDASVNGHSVKPDVFYDRVREASPGPRLEMFARRTRDGFVSWGNEVP